MSILPPQDLITLRQTDVVTNLEDRMDSLKAATGLGGGGAHQKEAGGEEPVAGQKGPGTVEEPYDQGNAEGEFFFFSFFFLIAFYEGREIYEGVSKR